MKKRYLKWSLVAALFLSMTVWIASCSKNYNKCVTPQVLTGAEVRALFPGKIVNLGDTSYQVVNSGFASDWDSWTDRTIMYLGATPVWRTQFDCNRFTSIKLAVMSVRFIVDTFHDSNVAQAPAAGEIWYIPDVAPNGFKGAGHSSIVTIESGTTGPRLVYRDIYSATELKMSQREIQSIYFIRF